VIRIKAHWRGLVCFFHFFSYRLKKPEREVSVSSLKELFEQALSEHGGTMLSPNDPIPKGKVAYSFEFNGEHFGAVVVDDFVQAAMIADHVKDNRPKGDLHIETNLVQR